MSLSLSLIASLSHVEEKSREAKEYGFFEEKMYFVSQLFEEDWQPGPSV
jgi:hypothetical protein